MLPSHGACCGATSGGTGTAPAAVQLDAVVGMARGAADVVPLPKPSGGNDASDDGHGGCLVNFQKRYRKVMFQHFSIAAK